MLQCWRMLASESLKACSFHLAFKARRQKRNLRLLSGNGNNERKGFRGRFSELDGEIAAISLPALASLAADPIAGLVDTAYIGKLGAVKLAAVGVALSVFNTVTKLFNIPLLAVTTSLVATAEGSHPENKHLETGRASSTAILLALVVGIGQAAALLLLGGPILGIWGAPASSSLRGEALTFLQIKAAGAPVTVLLLVIQGIFRGLGDAKTPLMATLVANAINIVLDPILIFVLHWGAPGAALATVVGQAVAVAGLLVALRERLTLSLAHDALGRAMEFLEPTGLLAVRSLAISGSFAMATSMAARTDNAHAAAHQICMQLWLASTLLSDALAVAAQSIMARNLAAEQRSGAIFVAQRVLWLGFGLGISTGFLFAAFSGLLPRLFTKEGAVLSAMATLFPWVIFTQPVTALAFVWDGILFGVSGFSYAAKAMAVCAVPAVSCMALSLLAPGQTTFQMNTIWAGLSLIMVLRALSMYLPFRSRSKPFEALFKE